MNDYLLYLLGRLTRVAKGIACIYCGDASSLFRYHASPCWWCWTATADYLHEDTPRFKSTGYRQTAWLLTYPGLFALQLLPSGSYPSWRLTVWWLSSQSPWPVTWPNSSVWTERTTWSDSKPTSSSRTSRIWWTVSNICKYFQIIACEAMFGLDVFPYKQEWKNLEDKWCNTSGKSIGLPYSNYICQRRFSFRDDACIPRAGPSQEGGNDEESAHGCFPSSFWEIWEKDCQKWRVYCQQVG